MLDYIFLTPIGGGISGNILPQYLKLQSWCDRNNSAILTCHGLFLNFARNYLATGGKGFVDTSPPNAEWLVWIDSDIQFSIEQIEDLVSVPSEYKFVTGWYRSNYSDQSMVGHWDEDFFRKHHHMPFTSVKWLTEIAKNEPDKLVQVDWCGFGFTKVHRSIFEDMQYPYFPLNEAKIEDCEKGNGDKFTLRDLSFEDVSFCQNCYEATQIKPIVVPRLRVGHYKSFFV
jgi:hypothetical protein